MTTTQDMLAYLEASQEELKALIRELCVIPAPSGKEAKKAAFVKEWFIENGFENVTVDEVLNVLAPYGITEDNKIAVISAHTDVVFPDETPPIPFHEDAERFYAPGVSDDTANLAVLMITARYFVQKKLRPRCGLLFAANSCEEGLGNLKGIRRIMEEYNGRVLEHISFDGTDLGETLTDVVGSCRYRVTVHTEGGHSFSHFGKPNAILELSRLIVDLNSFDIPKRAGSLTTRNVGVISGGTSVNAIPQEATMLCEYRSNDRTCMQIMKEEFEAVFARARERVSIDVSVVGERPCAGSVEEKALAELIARADESVRFATGQESVHTTESTDCNIPLSMGIPATCVGVVEGHGVHTREEFLVLSSLLPGCRRALRLLCHYFD